MASDNSVNTTLRKDLGPVSAYAVAVAHGFDGTEAEWEQYIANASANAQSAATSASNAATSENNAEAAKVAAVAAKTEAQTAAESASAAYGTSMLAPTFSTEVAYATGEHVIYNGSLYVFKTAHAAGEWDATQVTATNLGGEVSDLKSAITQLNDNVITESAGSAPIVSIKDGADGMPLRSLSVAVEPVQDLHGYENPWPAGGGKNLVGLNTSPGGTIEYSNVTASDHTDDSVKLTSRNNTYANMRLYYTLSTGTYTVKYQASVSDNNVGVAIYNGNRILMNPLSPNTEQSFTLAEQTLINIRFFVTLGTATARAVTFSQFQLETGSSASAWSPYSNICPITGWTGANVAVSPTSSPDDPDKEVYPITFPSQAGTVYGGTLTVNKDGSGSLVVDMEYVSDTWANGLYATDLGDNVRKLFMTVNNHISGQEKGNNKCNIAMWSYSYNNDYSHWYSFGNSKDIYLFLPENTPGNTVVQFVCEIATPVTYTLTPGQVKTLLGVNNIWADTGNILSVTYPADTKLYIDKKFAELSAAITALRT